MPKNKKAHNLSKLLTYALGRKPGEFGLVPDPDGNYKIKDVLKAIGEEDGFRWVRRAHLNEILLTVPEPGFEITGSFIRPTCKPAAAMPQNAADLPKLLYTCVRRKAYPHVIEKGLKPSHHRRIVLSDDKDLAERMGRRSDAQPVLLTVQVAHARNRGVFFQSAGQNIYLAPEIPPDCFRGPALPKERDRKLSGPDAAEKKRSATPGSFTIDISALEKTPDKRGGGKDTGGRGRPRRKSNQPKRQRPPWRR
jgi:putative RNA 2'-phosphotransferase